MNNDNETLHIKLKEACALLKLTSVANYAIELEATAKRQGLSHLQFLLQIFEKHYEILQERKAARCIKAAKFDRVKTLDGFDFGLNAELPETLIRELVTGSFIKKVEPIIFVGESGTGKTHLATAIGYSNASLGYKVRFITAAELANQLIEAKDARELSKYVKQYSQFDVLIIDELGFLPLSQVDAELIFQVLSKRHEKKATIITTNLPFSEWDNIFKDPRLCRAIIDRITYTAHIIDTGEKSIRLDETLKNRNKSEA